MFDEDEYGLESGSPSFPVKGPPPMPMSALSIEAAAVDTESDEPLPEISPKYRRARVKHARTKARALRAGKKAQMARHRGDKASLKHQLAECRRMKKHARKLKHILRAERKELSKYATPQQANMLAEQGAADESGSEMLKGDIETSDFFGLDEIDTNEDLAVAEVIATSFGVEDPDQYDPKAAMMEAAGYSPEEWSVDARLDAQLKMLEEMGVSVSGDDYGDDDYLGEDDDDFGDDEDDDEFGAVLSPANAAPYVAGMVKGSTAYVLAPNKRGAARAARRLLFFRRKHRKFQKQPRSIRKVGVVLSPGPLPWAPHMPPPFVPIPAYVVSLRRKRGYSGDDDDLYTQDPTLDYAVPSDVADAGMFSADYADDQFGSGTRKTHVGRLRELGLLLRRQITALKRLKKQYGAPRTWTKAEAQQIRAVQARAKRLSGAIRKLRGHLRTGHRLPGSRMKGDFDDYGADTDFLDSTAPEGLWEDGVVDEFESGDVLSGDFDDEFDGDFDEFGARAGGGLRGTPSDPRLRALMTKAAGGIAARRGGGSSAQARRMAAAMSSLISRPARPKTRSKGRKPSKHLSKSQRKSFKHHSGIIAKRRKQIAALRKSIKALSRKTSNASKSASALRRKIKGIRKRLKRLSRFRSGPLKGKVKDPLRAKIMRDQIKKLGKALRNTNKRLRKVQKKNGGRNSTIARYRKQIAASRSKQSQMNKLAYQRYGDEKRAAKAKAKEDRARAEAKKAAAEEKVVIVATVASDKILSGQEAQDTAFTKEAELVAEVAQTDLSPSALVKPKVVAAQAEVTVAAGKADFGVVNVLEGVEALAHVDATPIYSETFEPVEAGEGGFIEVPVEGHRPRSWPGRVARHWDEEPQEYWDAAPEQEYWDAAPEQQYWDAAPEQQYWDAEPQQQWDDVPEAWDAAYFEPEWADEAGMEPQGWQESAAQYAVPSLTQSGLPEEFDGTQRRLDAQLAQLAEWGVGISGDDGYGLDPWDQFGDECGDYGADDDDLYTQWPTLDYAVPSDVADAGMFSGGYDSDDDDQFGFKLNWGGGGGAGAGGGKAKGPKGPKGEPPSGDSIMSFIGGLGTAALNLGASIAANTGKGNSGAGNWAQTTQKNLNKAGGKAPAVVRQTTPPPTAAQIAAEMRAQTPPPPPPKEEKSILPWVGVGLAGTAVIGTAIWASTR
ncbi:hypothetical protein CMI47_17970 [Candidatus Pacearchaeota archaeon]|nr:hypothetical protein [Candidatus Pacearchaeota archaeon]